MRNRESGRVLCLAALCAATACAPWLGRQPAPVPPAPEAKPPEIVQIDPLVGISELDPYFTEGVAKEAACALAQNRLEDARIGFDAAAVELDSDPELGVRARFLAAYLAQGLGDHARAVAELPALAEELPLVADVALAAAAESALALGKPADAIAYAERVPQDSGFAARAALVRADAMRLDRRFSDAADAYRAFIARWPADERSPEARADLVACLAEIATASTPPSAAQAGEGLALIEALRADAPGGRFTREAGKQEDRLLAVLGREPEVEKRETAAALDAYEAASSLMRRMRHAEAERAYARALRLSRQGGTLACRIRFEQATVVARQRDHARAAALFGAVAEDCRADPNIAVRALYQGGKEHMSADEYEAAVRLFAAVEADFPSHSYADDARLNAARCRLALGDREGFAELLKSLPDAYPNGDMRGEALWSLAFDALGRGDDETARDALSRYHEEYPVEEGWYAAGRSGYWLGRVDEQLGRTDEAIAAYEHVVATAPLTYYMVLANAHLSALDPERAESLLEGLAPAGEATAPRFERALLEETPGLAEAVELMRLGLAPLARGEFERILARKETPASVHWFAAALFRRAGEFTAAKELTGGGDAGWERRYPAGSDFVYWTLAFPAAWEAEVGAAAAESGVPRELLWAVMREESGFSASVESWANAVGLMQLILPTARSMAKRISLGAPVTAKSLRDPTVNIRLGAAYLAYLGEKFGGNPALVIAGYNAGEGAVKKWLAAKPGGDLDMFVETIPYAQTRGYTKRVLASLATYRFLYGPGRTVFAPPLTL
jgi:soluble lytic murein transglycosylase